MNQQLQTFARDSLKAGLPRLPEESLRMFRLMYARDGGRRSMEDALAMDINAVVDAMPADKLDWAMQQLAASLSKIATKGDTHA